MIVNIFLSFVIILIGIYGLCFSKNIIKSIICLNLTQTSVILLFLNLAYVKNGVPPILPANSSSIVDPLPQALMITTIVIGASITALALMLSIKVFHYYGTLEWKSLVERKD